MAEPCENAHVKRRGGAGQHRTWENAQYFEGREEREGGDWVDSRDESGELPRLGKGEVDEEIRLICEEGVPVGSMGGEAKG